MDVYADMRETLSINGLIDHSGADRATPMVMTVTDRGGCVELSIENGEVGIGILLRPDGTYCTYSIGG